MLRDLRPAWVAASAKKLIGIKRIPLHVDAGTFHIDPISHFGCNLIQHRAYEPAMTDTLRRYLKPGGVFVDVGANEGYFSVLASCIVGPSGRVIAVEPQSRLQEVLRENFRLNGLTNVSLVQAAVSNEDGASVFHLSPDVNTGSSGLSLATKYQVETEQVRTSTLSRILSEAAVDHVDLMKMDIEGFEYEAILGSLDLFRKGIVRALALELHRSAISRRGLDAELLLESLREFKYELDESCATTVYVYSVT
ncbi:MAG: FkbM family methyltransferase [Pirellulales bacterium]